jgi:hypothetical protein
MTDSTKTVQSDFQMYGKGFAIAPSDTVDFANLTQAIHCNVAGAQKRPSAEFETK